VANDPSARVRAYRQQLHKALGHLAYSYEKVLTLSAHPSSLDDEQLETWEGFVARFGRAADIFTGRFLRAYILREDAGFRGTMRDQLDFAERLRLIDSAAEWMAIRELRNRAVHEYDDGGLPEHFAAVRAECPKLLALESQLDALDL
jgi:hypothetical protein